MINAPCKDCQDRHIDCHSTCQKYLLFRQEQDEVNRVKTKEAELRTYDIERLSRHKKRKQK